MATITPPYSDTWSKAIAYIWNKRPDLAEFYSSKGWGVTSWADVVRAVMDWAQMDVNKSYNGDPIALATSLGYVDEEQAATRPWIRDAQGNLVQVNPDTLTPNYGAEKPWERQASDAQRYWTQQGWVIDPNWSFAKEHPNGQYKEASSPGGINKLFYQYEIAQPGDAPQGATVIPFQGKYYAQVQVPQVYQWKNTLTGEYRFSPVAANQQWNPANPGSVPTITGAGQMQQAWNFNDVLKTLGLDPNSITWNVSSSWAPTVGMQEILKSTRNVPTSLMMLKGGNQQEVTSTLQNSPFVQSLMNYAGTTGATGNTGFSFITGKQLPARQALSFMGSQGSEGAVPNLISGLAEYSGQNAPSFWKQFEHYLPKGEKASPTTFI